MILDIGNWMVGTGMSVRYQIAHKENKILIKKFEQRIEVLYRVNEAFVDEIKRLGFIKR